ncbi:MAG TPA: PDZ domain-containing protein [Gemmatimonadaceae bacterium]|nr:PDZ domain-containing protein [Gemmatimonadaceae bacterium]
MRVVPLLAVAPLAVVLATSLAAQAAPNAAAAPRAAAAPPIEYEIAFPNAAHHEAEVAITFRALPPRALEVRMSRSSPGRYALHEFAKNVYAFRAVDSKGRALRVTRPNPHQWDVSGHDGTVKVTYTLFGDRGDGTYAGIDRSMAHLNTPATFAWARGLEGRGVRVTFHLPDPSWTVATQLFPTRDSMTFTAPHFQYFMDSPVHLGKQSWHSWPVRANGRTYSMRIALHHLGTADEEARYVDATKKIVEQAAAVFGTLPDFDGGTYTFLSTYLPWAAGDGMEHRNSTSLTSTGSLATSMSGLLGTVSHEFFHAWNVERIRPRSLEPFSFEHANMSGELWLAEGFTSYYGPLVLRRAAILDDAQLAVQMAGAVNLVLNAPGRRFFSAVDMSRQAPFTDAAVSIDPQNKGNTFISYYPFGQAIALALDLTLRGRGKTLDDFMREMWQAHGAQRNYAPVRPYTIADARAALARVTGDAAFARDFFARYIEGREAPPYADLLRQAGFLLRPARPNAAWAGDVAVRFEKGAAVVLAPTPIGSPLYAAGVDRNDRITALDGRALNDGDDFDGVLASHKPGDVVPITYESRGTTVTTTLTLAANPRIEIVPFEAAGEPMSAPMRAFRTAWLGAR